MTTQQRYRLHFLLATGMAAAIVAGGVRLGWPLDYLEGLFLGAGFMACLCDGDTALRDHLKERRP